MRTASEKGKTRPMAANAMPTKIIRRDSESVASFIHLSFNFFSRIIFIFMIILKAANPEPERARKRFTATLHQTVPPRRTQNEIPRSRTRAVASIALSCVRVCACHRLTRPYEQKLSCWQSQHVRVCEKTFRVSPSMLMHSFSRVTQCDTKLSAPAVTPTLLCK